ncbi:hypothetical protein [Pelomonas sp. KK5]|uniref:hypothetical protein n=1 Tax=Pelomonas sp. KK5 TaxID=1855730 RepID=UPI00117CE56A|nr:hypothetical protein [Pelomonas sp. KK5]
MFVILVALTWVGLKAGVIMILAVSWGLVVSAVILKLSPFTRPVFEVGRTEIAYGRDLGSKVPISAIKYAIPGGPTANAWPGATSVLLEMEARVVGGQRYYERKVVQLFCVDTPAEEIAERINFFVQERVRHAG